MEDGVKAMDLAVPFDPGLMMNVARLKREESLVIDMLENIRNAGSHMQSDRILKDWQRAVLKVRLRKQEVDAFMGTHNAHKLITRVKGMASEAKCESKINLRHLLLQIQAWKRQEEKAIAAQLWRARQRLNGLKTQDQQLTRRIGEVDEQKVSAEAALRMEACVRHKIRAASYAKHLADLHHERERVNRRIEEEERSIVALLEQHQLTGAEVGHVSSELAALEWYHPNNGDAYHWVTENDLNRHDQYELQHSDDEELGQQQQQQQQKRQPEAAPEEDREGGGPAGLHQAVTGAGIVLQTGEDTSEPPQHRRQRVADRGALLHESSPRTAPDAVNEVLRKLGAIKQSLQRSGVLTKHEVQLPMYDFEGLSNTLHSAMTELEGQAADLRERVRASTDALHQAESNRQEIERRWRAEEETRVQLQAEHRIAKATIDALRAEKGTVEAATLQKSFEQLEAMRMQLRATEGLKEALEKDLEAQRHHVTALDTELQALHTGVRQMEAEHTELCTRTRTAEAMSASLRVSVEELAQRIEEGQKGMEQLQGELCGERSMREQLVSERDVAVKRVRELEAEQMRAENVLVDNEAARAALEARLRSEEAAAATLKRELQTAEKLLRDLEAANARMSEELASQRVKRVDTENTKLQLATELERVSAEKADVVERLAFEYKRCVRMQESLDDLNRRLGAVVEEKLALGQLVDQDQSSLRDLQTDKLRLVQQLQASEAAFSDMKRRVEVLEAEAGAARGRAQELEGSLNDAQEEVGVSALFAEGLQASLSTLTEEMRRMVKEKEALERRLHESEVKRQELLVQVEALLREREAVEVMMEGYKSDNERLTSEAEEVTARYEGERRRMGQRALELQQGVEWLQGERDDVTARLVEAQWRVQALEQAHMAAEARLSAALARSIDLEDTLEDEREGAADIKAENERLLEELRGLEGQVKRFAAEVSAERRKIEEARVELCVVVDAKTTMEQQLQEYRRAMQELETENQELQARCTEAQHTSQKVLREKVAVEHSLPEISQSLQEMKDEQDAVVRRARDAEVHKNEVEAQRMAVTFQLRHVMSQLKEEKKARVALQEEVDRLTIHLAQLQRPSSPVAVQTDGSLHTSSTKQASSDEHPASSLVGLTAAESPSEAQTSASGAVCEAAGGQRVALHEDQEHLAAGRQRRLETVTSNIKTVEGAKVELQARVTRLLNQRYELQAALHATLAELETLPVETADIASQIPPPVASVKVEEDEHTSAVVKARINELRHRLQDADAQIEKLRVLEQRVDADLASLMSERKGLQTGSL